MTDERHRSLAWTERLDANRRARPRRLELIDRRNRPRTGGERQPGRARSKATFGGTGLETGLSKYRAQRIGPQTQAGICRPCGRSRSARRQKHCVIAQDLCAAAAEGRSDRRLAGAGRGGKDDGAGR